MIRGKKSVDGNHKPPSRSRNVFSDIVYFLLNKPKQKTLIRFESEEQRLEYVQRMEQRIGFDVNRNSVLNMHRIGINAPVSYVFNELLNWNGDSTCWPNNIARVKRIDDKLEHIKILPMGMKKYPFGAKSFFGLRLIPLFSLNCIRFKKTPDSFDFDNARYLLYRSSGGYPIGIFTMYVRSPIEELGEKAKAQLFFVVSFNFYGKEEKAGRMVNKLWQAVHNRVTANVLNRIKQLSEWRIRKLEKNYEYL